VQVERLSFQEDPAAHTAQWLIREGLNPLKTMMVVPTQRFKTYFASCLLELRGTKSVLPPRLITSSDLIREMIAGTGKQQANYMEKLTLLYRACEQTEEITVLYPREFLGSFSSFLKVASRFLRTFEELAREEIDLKRHLENGSSRPSFVQKQLGTLLSLWRNYYDQQEKAGRFDPSFLLGEIGSAAVMDYLDPVTHILLVSPLSLTRFERRLFGYVEDRLTVVYQDTEDYDFSRILTFRSKEAGEGRPGKDQRLRGSVRFFQASSRMEQVMLILSLIGDEVEHGAEPQEIAVINSDSQSAMMLYDALTQMGIEANYSEGLSTKSSPLYQFLLLVSRFFDSGLDSGIFLELIRNEFFTELLGNEYDGEWHSTCEDIRNTILHRRIFRLSSLKGSLFERNEGMGEACTKLQRLYESKSFSELYTCLDKFFSGLRGRKTYDFYAMRDALLDSSLELCDLSLPLPARPLDMLLQVVKSERYALQGVYARGVQILGLLESRAIGFRTVIVPSFNEGCFPLKRENDILLPTDIRDMLGLPTLLDREELGFYYLKRIADMAQDLSFITLTDGGGDVDMMSRYAYLFGITERGFEKKMRCALPVWRDASVPSQATSDQPSMFEAIQRFSRMDIARLKGCETQYYIASVLGIHEPDELVREIEPSLVGLQVHRVFTDLYRDLDFDNLDPFRLEENLMSLLDKHFREGFFYSREEVLVKKILSEKLLISLRQDIMRFQEGYRICPGFIEKTLNVEINGGRYRVRGRIDRVDQSPSGAYVLIDYKTGTLPVDRAHFEEAGYSEVQLGFYGLLLKYAQPESSIESLCYFDLSGDNKLKPVVQGEEVDAYLTGFEVHLVEFLDRFNAKSGLSLAEDLETCTFCPYDTICRIYEE
jgi:RecB family exonuclease